MDPSQSELKAFQNINDICVWIGFEDVEDKKDGNGVERLSRSSFLSCLGAPSLVRQLVAIPAEAWAMAATSWEVQVFTYNNGEKTPSFVNPSPVELGHVGALRRIARLSLGLGSEQGPSLPDAVVTNKGAENVTSMLMTAPGAATYGKRILMSKVLEQNSDSEVAPLSADTLRALLDDWIANANEGEEPTEDEEATSDQLSSLDALAKAGAIPFVDFGVCRPFGNRLGNALRFVIQVERADGTRQSKEINGPDSFDVWLRCWTVFVFAMTALKLASKTRLQLGFEDTVAALCGPYQEAQRRVPAVLVGNRTSRYPHVLRAPGAHPSRLRQASGRGGTHGLRSEEAMGRSLQRGRSLRDVLAAGSRQEGLAIRSCRLVGRGPHRR